MEDNSVVKQEKTPHRWQKGECGNPNGRPRKPEIEQLREALYFAEEKNNKSFLQHFVERAYKNDQVGIALAKKLLPDKIDEQKTYDVDPKTYGYIQVFRSMDRETLREFIDELRERIRKRKEESEVVEVNGQNGAC